VSEPTLFERIITGEIPGQIVAESEHAVALRDIDPKAPSHVLVVTRHPYPDVAALAAADPDALVDLHLLAARVAESEGIAGSGWRLVFNTGADGGQTVPHVHGHVLGGRPLTWPPG
jgi:histidine triad (HIT) family protein